MKFASVRLLPLALLGMLLLMSRCAVIPTCPNELLPVVEIQINNTASNHDDYGTVSSFTACRARITNYARFGGGYNFPGGVSVELRNPNSSGNLQYSAIANPVIGTPSVFITLPEDGGWFNFSIKGNTANMVDKAISIEMSTAGSCDEVVLARKALMIAKGDPPISQTAALGRVELEIGSVATLDDYITWSPTSCRIRWSSGTAGSTLPVTLQNMGSTDRIRFADSSLAGGQTAVNAALPLVLNGDGSWVNFYIAGNYQHASVRDKDAVIEVSETASGQILSREGLMVRIRKNANTLTANERNRYLEALKKMDLTYNDYIDFVKTHSRDNTGSGGSLIAHKQAHGGSGFLPWHRVFVMHLERILQAADPAVSVPYWKFDDNAPAIFTPNYFGSNSGGNFATLSATNPIVSWTLPGEGVSTGIQRNTPYGDGGHPNVADETADMALGGPTFAYGPNTSDQGFRSMEVITHNRAHAFSGFTNAAGDPLPGASWVGGSPSIAPRDPIFFSLHCNVDRLWAKWQWLHDRNTQTDILAYDLQGSVNAPGAGVPAPNVNLNRMLGQYADDSMWPWDNVTGGTINSITERPNIAILKSLPITLTAILPGSRPTVRSVIDYLSITNTKPASNLGFAYDDFFPY